METKRLLQFKTIVDVGGLLKASEILGISGGGLSKSIKALEDELGAKVFVQQGRGLELTSIGRELYERIPTVLRSIEDLLQFREKTVDQEQPLRIVSFEVFTTYFLASFAHSHLAGSLRGRRLEIREAIPGEMEKSVAQNHSDLAITYMPIPYTDVEFQKVGRIRMGVFGRTDIFKNQQLDEAPFAVPVSPLHGTPSGVQGLDGWPDHLFTRHSQFRVEMMETAMELCRNGDAVAFLPQFVVQLGNRKLVDEFRIKELPLPKGLAPVYRDIHLIKRKGYSETKSVRLLAKALRALD